MNVTPEDFPLRKGRRSEALLPTTEEMRSTLNEVRGKGGPGPHDDRGGKIGNKGKAG